MLSTWIPVLEKDTSKLWDKSGGGSVKDFRTCFDFVETVLEGYVLAALTTELCGHALMNENKSNQRPLSIEHDLEEFIKTHPIADEAAAKAVTDLAAGLTDFNFVDFLRSELAEERDYVWENVILYMQHGLILRSFDRALSDGDVGRAIASLSYFTIWFQKSSRHNYAAETLRLSACLKKVWSKDLVKFYMDNCLINISGRAGAFQPCDKLNENFVDYVKSNEYAHASAEATAFQHQDRALLTMEFLDIRDKLAEQLGVEHIKDFHHTVSDNFREVKIVANSLLTMKGFEKKPGRGVGLRESQAKDLYMQGLLGLADGAGLDNLKEAWYKDRQINVSHFVCDYVKQFKPED